MAAREPGKREKASRERRPAGPSARTTDGARMESAPQRTPATRSPFQTMESAVCPQKISTPRDSATLAKDRPRAAAETRGRPCMRMAGGTNGSRRERDRERAWKESRTTGGPSGRSAKSRGSSNAARGSGRTTAPESRWPPGWADFSRTAMRMGRSVRLARRMAQARPAGPAPTTSASVLNWPWLASMIERPGPKGLPGRRGRM